MKAENDKDIYLVFEYMGTLPPPRQSSTTLAATTPRAARSSNG
jgi:hypothetical protein